jgi:poly(A) polymerase
LEDDVPPQSTVQLAPLAITLAEAFRAHGESLYLVGGAVRDELLGRAGLDLDFAASALPECTARIVEQLGLGSPYRVGEKFGTIGVHADRYRIEITTYRAREMYASGSRKPTVAFGDSLDQDLARRDFTVNAMAVDPLTGRLIDPFSGLDDLASHRIRAVGEPARRFEEDPLRLLRAIRFACGLNFTIDEATWEAVSRCAPRIREISRERVRHEYSKILQSDRPAHGLTLLRDSGLLADATPQLVRLTRMPDHGPRHPLSLWDHTMRVVEHVQPDLTIRWAAVLHDVAKPDTRTREPSGRPRFFHHEEVGARIAREVLRDLRYPNQVIDDVCTLVESHMQLHGYSSEWTDGAVRRLMLRLGPLLEPALELVRADAAGHSPDRRSANAPKFDALCARIALLETEPARRARSPLSGDDLMARYSRPPGPWIREVKERLLDEVLEGHLRLDDRQLAWQIADEVIANQR